MSANTIDLQELATLCKALKVPTIARQAPQLAAEAERHGRGHLAYLVEALRGEVQGRQERRSARRVREANFPVVKSLESFDFARAPHLPEPKLRELAHGGYIDAAETVLFIGDPGTGKTHLATALGVAAAEQGRRVRFVTAAGLATELQEAKDARELGRVVARYSRIDVLVVDELGYIPLSKADAELFFRVVGERHERLPIVVTTNLPFSEWTAMIPDPRLCRALVDRLTHRSHIIDTGKDSIRLSESKARR